MKGLELIKEEIFPVKSKPWIKDIFSHMSEECIGHYRRVYSIYVEVDKEIKPIYATIGDIDRHRIGFKKSFVNHIKKYKPTNFKDILFFLGIYDYFRKVYWEKAIIEFSHPKSSKYEVIESILEASRGIILWHYQLEDILNLFFQNRNEIVSIRKEINAKKAATFKMLKKHKLDEKLTLEDFIWERMILDCVKFPNIYGASILYNLLS